AARGGERAGGGGWRARGRGGGGGPGEAVRRHRGEVADHQGPDRRRGQAGRLPRAGRRPGRRGRPPVPRVPAGGPPRRYTPPPPWRPFPTDALPEPWAELVRQGAAALGCDKSYLALPALAVIAGAVGNTRTLFLGRN